MGALNAWAVTAVVLAAIGGTLVGTYACRSWSRRSSAMGALVPDGRHALLLRLQNGVGCLRKPAARLLRLPAVSAIAADGVILVGERGADMTATALVSVVLAAGLLAIILGWALASSPVFGVALGCLVVAAAWVATKRITDSQSIAMREKVPDALRSFATCFRSGLSLMQTLQQTADEMGGRLGRLLKVAADRLEMGAPTSEALAVLRNDQKVPELSFIAVALDIQHQSGGSLAPVLESAKESVESELDLMRSLRVQTAQARLSASIVTIMPFILVAFFSLMSPGFLMPFFSSLVGMALLALALAMQVTGVLVVRHMLAMDAGPS